MVGLLAACGPLPPGDRARPDIVLVSIDSLRADHLSTYGYERHTSPFIDWLADTGQRFEDARSSSPWTLPGHVTMLSGQWPTTHAVVEDNLRPGEHTPMVQSALQAAGWATGGFVSAVYVSSMYGFDRGFDRFEDFGITEETNLRHDVHAARVLGEATRFVIEKGAGKPAFLFVHIYDVHYPYRASTSWDNRFDVRGGPGATGYRNYFHYLREPLAPQQYAHLRSAYDECISEVDDALRRFAGSWRASARPVRFVFTADHGEEFGERGSWGHAHTLYTEQLHVPLIVGGDGVEHRVRTERVGTVDVAATVAGLAGLTWPGPGVDVLGAVPDRAFVAETSRFDTARLSLTVGDRRLDLDLNPERLKGGFAMPGLGARAVYDLAKDPLERTPLAQDPRALEEQLLRALPENYTLSEGAGGPAGWAYREGAWVAGLGGEPFGVYPPDAAGDATPTGPVPSPVSLGDATKEQLKALGYQQ